MRPVAKKSKKPTTKRAPARSAPKRNRATRGEIERRKAHVFAAVKRRKGWFAISEVRITKEDPALGRTLSLLVADGKLEMQGERRFARYRVFVGKGRKAA